jgi:hypothetical protein
VTDLKTLGNELLSVGRLIGLITKDDGRTGVNTGWFANPTAELGNAHKRLDALVELLGLVLQQTIANPPQVFPKAQWHPIPDPLNRKETVFHVVTSDGEPRGKIGLGILHSTAVGVLKIRAFAHIPLASYSREGSEFLTAKEACAIGVEVSKPDGFVSGSISFSGFTIKTEIFLSGGAPSFQLKLNDLKGSARDTFSTLDDVLKTGSGINLAECLDAVLSSGSYWLNQYLGSSAATPGSILESAGFLQHIEKTTKYKIDRPSLEQMRQKTAAEIALDFLFKGLDALANWLEPLFTIPGGDVSVVHRGSDYGLRISAQLPLKKGSRGDGKNSPAVDLCLGKWLKGEDEAKNWITRCGSHAEDAGLLVFLLKDEAGRRSFSPSLELSGVGLNVAGPGDAPLFNINGYTLKGAELRTFARFGRDKVLGFAIHLDEVGFPIGSSFGQAQQRGGNAVAKSLVASGEQQPGSDDKSAVNPAFSAKACYVTGKDALLELYDPDGNRTDLIWFPIQRHFGPLDCKKVGLRIHVSGDHKDDPILGVVFDGGVKLPALDVRLDQLAANVHLKRIADVSGYDLDLQGMAVTFDSSPVSLSAGLFKSRESDGSVAYDGQALLKFKDLTISAIGSFSSPAGIGTSMFIFAMMNKPLGGPAFFFVTGLAAGFGYNRGLRIPGQDEVTKFPLISCLGSPPQDLTKALTTLREGGWVAPARGEYWLAAGIQFTTFRLLNTSAVLIVQFGKELIISVLGISTLKQPQQGQPYIYAKLGIRAVFRPARGELMVSAVLAPGSYVFDENAKLTGGFAMAAWFSPSEHAGEFVYTIGGYHPAFNVPAHYPRVPRVGINWQISSKITMLGEAYFAITPVAMMAGGALQVTFSAGPLQAWLKARLDVLVYWKPFYLMADVAVAVGVSFHINALFVDTTISAEIGCAFSFWGPPVGFSVHIDWYIISFTISHGDPGARNSLTWSDFKDLLPAKSNVAPRSLAAEASTIQAAAAPSGYLAVNANDGLARTHNLTSDLVLWLVRPGSFRVTVSSAAPSTRIVFVGSDKSDQRECEKVSPRRLSGKYQATLKITILNLGEHASADGIRACLAAESTADCGAPATGCGKPAIALSSWEKATVSGKLPAAMWRAAGETGDEVNINTPSPNVAATVGATMYPLAPKLTNCTPQMKIADVFADRTIYAAADEWWLPISRKTAATENNSRAAASFLNISKMNTPEVAGKRDGLLKALNRFGFEGLSSGTMNKMANDPGSDFADEPREGSPATLKGAAA